MPNQYNHNVELIEEVSLKAAVKAVGKPYRNKKANERLLHKVIVVRKHESIAEHIIFKFDITGISRAVLQELVRHRIGSFTVESSRFCLEKILKEYKEDATKVLTEDNIKVNETMLKTTKEMTAKYVNLNLEGKDERLQCAMLESIHKILNMLVNLSKEGLSNDDLKPFLPEGFRTTLVWTINLRALNNFLQLRTDKHAFIEMRMFAEEVQKLAKSTAAGFLVYPTSTEQHLIMSNTKPNIVFKRAKDSYNWEIDKEILKKIYEDIDGDATMGDIEQVLLSVEKYQKEFFKNE